MSLITLPKPKYHVYLEYDKNVEKSGMRFNLTEEELQRTFITPLNEGKPLMFMGRLLLPSKVDKVIIFWSYEDGGTLVLPNREMVAGHLDKKLVMEKIGMGRVKGAQICTEKFLPTRQK